MHFSALLPLFYIYIYIFTSAIVKSLLSYVIRLFSLHFFLHSAPEISHLFHYHFLTVTFQFRCSYIRSLVSYWKSQKYWHSLSILFH